MQKFEEKTLERKEIFTGHVIKVAVDTVSLPNGKTATRELVFHNGAVAIIPFTKDGKLLLVKQFRKPLEKTILEIPAGKIDPEDKDHLDTARRELEEETHYQTNALHLVASFYVAPGFANEFIYLYEATELTLVDNPRPQDEDEFLALVTLTLSEAKKAISDGLICDAKTMYAIQYWEIKQLKERNER